MVQGPDGSAEARYPREDLTQLGNIRIYGIEETMRARYLVIRLHSEIFECGGYGLRRYLERGDMYRADSLVYFRVAR